MVASLKARKMVSDTQKLLMRAFNSECDDLISRVKYTNFDATLDRIYKSAEAISKLGTIMSISITQPYLDAKVKELRLAFEYQQKKQQEKEELKAARAAAARTGSYPKRKLKNSEKESKKSKHITKLLMSIYSCSSSKNLTDADSLEKKAQLESHIKDIEKAIADIDYRAGEYESWLRSA